MLLHDVGGVDLAFVEEMTPLCLRAAIGHGPIVKRSRETLALCAARIATALRVVNDLEEREVAGLCVVGRCCGRFGLDLDRHALRHVADPRVVYLSSDDLPIPLALVKDGESWRVDADPVIRMWSRRN
jgi:hypothetical protein